MPLAVRSGQLEIHGPLLGAGKAKIMRLLRCFIPGFVRNNLHNQFAEQTKKRILGEDLSLFKIIHIETRTLCNGLCSFCPAAAQYNVRPDAYMSRELYFEIIRQLQVLNYTGRLSPYCNNEPLIDERIFDFLEQTRRMCPESHLELKTNGRNLSLKKLQLLIDLGLNEIFINDYANTNNFSPNIKGIIEAILKNELDFKKSKIVVIWRRQKDILQNRAGKSPNLPALNAPLKRFCSRAFEMMTIGTEGQIGICSSDFNFQHILGNINEMGLLEAWQGSEYQRIRQSLLQRDRSCTLACSRCDYHAYYLPDLKGLYQWIRWV